MPQFRFNTISKADIERSPGGKIMIYAIDYDGTNHQLISGVPGSGKTTVTIMRAERLINEGKKIIVFTYQNLLRVSLRNIASTKLRGKIYGFFDWYSSSYGYLDRGATAEQMKERIGKGPIADEILVDEGQDFEERIYRSLISACPKLTVGADNAQKIHENGLLSSEIREILEAEKPVAHVPLEYNYRNTFEIYAFARFFMPDNERAQKPISLELLPKGNGTKPIIFQTRDDDEKFRRIKVLLENSGDRNIAILLYHVEDVNTYHKRLSEMGFSCTKHHSNSHAETNIENILITTYKSAKGLEFQVVIMPDMHTAMQKFFQTSEHYYIACTRAKETLYLTYTGRLPNIFSNFDAGTYDLRTEYLETDTTTDDLPF
jgi:superfamily I DNA/RNA helicase